MEGAVVCEGRGWGALASLGLSRGEGGCHPVSLGCSEMVAEFSLAPWGLGSRQVTCPQGPAEPRAEKQPWLPGLKVKSLALKPKRVNAFILHSSGETIVTVM